MRVIAGTLKGRKLKTTKKMNVRPTSDRVKEALFNILGEKINGAFFLDAFAGVGSIGIEALSRGANRCIFIEKDKANCALIQNNLELTGLNSRAEILCTDVFRAFKILNQKKIAFNFVFIDPPYDYALLANVLEKIITYSILLAGGEVIIEQRNIPGNKDFFSQNELPIKLCSERIYGDTLLTFGKPEILEDKQL